MTMKGEQLEIMIADLKEKLSDRKIQRNMLQIEKDMIHDFYHNTREEIKELDSKVLNFDTDMQTSEDQHRSNISSHMQKVKHLEYEHINSCDVVKNDAIEEMKEERDHHTKTEETNISTKGERKQAHQRDELANIADIQDREKNLEGGLEDLQ